VRFGRIFGKMGSKLTKALYWLGRGANYVCLGCFQGDCDSFVTKYGVVFW
jgi:hypothetical protein